MIVLDTYGKIEKTLISRKLHLYIANLPNEKDNEWNEYLFQVMEKEIKLQELERLEFQRYHGMKLDAYDLDYIKKIYDANFNSCMIDENPSIDEYLQCFANHMICLFFDYDYEDMPFFDWTTNCFDSRFCEEDYAEKIIDFIRFIAKCNKDELTPNCIYSSNHNYFEKTRVVSMLQFKRPINTKEYIAGLQKWGLKIDKFLEEENDYYQLDYLINSLYKDREYNTNHLFKDFSILEMLLVRPGEKTNTIDDKLSIFLQVDYGTEARKLAIVLRQMRNKIGHGDFIGFYEKAEEYATVHMVNFNFDYSEFSRLNWVLSNVCCLLDDLVAKVINVMFDG